MGRIRAGKWFFYLLGFPLTLAICGWQGWKWWSWASEAPTVPIASDTLQSSNTGSGATTPGSMTFVTVPDGTSAKQIGTMLMDAQLIRSTVAWDLWTRWQTSQGREGGFLAGTYAIPEGESMEAIANKIWQGEVVQLSFTIPEGWSIAQMADYFEQREWFTANDFILATRQVTAADSPWLPPGTITSDGSNLEGFLYPSTYEIASNPTPEMIVQQMLGQFERTALPLYQNNQDQTSYTLLEWVTLASIVEREAVVQDERPTIAAVFARRLREGIPLATDPTVEYAFGIRQTPDRPLTYAEVGTPHPYNTYINVGLPPGPIAAPGLASLEVSLNPGDTEYLYFMARFDGTHIFSQTLAQHEAAKSRVGAQIKAGERPWENEAD